MRRDQRRHPSRGARSGTAGSAIVLTIALIACVALPGVASASAARGLTAGITPVWVAKPMAQLAAADPSSYDKLGTSVALSGGSCLVGAPYKAVGGVQEAGAAYVFTGSAASWARQAELTASDGAAFDEFGYAVAVDGDTAFVGAPRRAVDGESEAGVVYVLTRAGSQWTETAELTAGDARAGDQFGSSMAVCDGTLLVGAPGRGAGGVAYVFTGVGGTWVQQAELSGDGTGGRDEFGFSVAVSGDIALVGAPSADSAYFFARSGTTWTGAKVAAPTGAGGFGRAVALSGDTALIAAPFGSWVNGYVGTVYPYVESTDAWDQQAARAASDGGAYDGFGGSVALSGDMALVARPAASEVYVFARSAGMWTQQSRGGSGSALAAGAYGTAMALSGDTAAIGAPAASVEDSDACGVAYACSLLTDATPPVTSASVFPKPNAAGWYTQPVTFTLTAHDAVAGVEQTFYQLLGWSPGWTTYALPFSSVKEGVSTLKFYSVDWAGLTEAVESVTVKIDSVPPATTALGDYYPTKGHLQTLTCQLVDPAKSPCTVRLQMLKRGRVVQTTLVGRKTPGIIRVKWRATLARGRYTYRFTAVDITGHHQSKAVSAPLVIR